MERRLQGIKVGMISKNLEGEQSVRDKKRVKIARDKTGVKITRSIKGVKTISPVNFTPFISLVTFPFYPL